MPLMRRLLRTLLAAAACACSGSSGTAGPSIAVHATPTDAPEGSPITVEVAVSAGTVASGTLTLGGLAMDLGLGTPTSASFTVTTWAPAAPPGGAMETIALDVADAAGRKAHAETAIHVSDVGKARLFAMGWHMHPSDGFSPEAFDAAMQGLVDAVKPNLAADRPNLLVFPEHCGLVNILGSSYAAKAQTEAQIVAAFGDLAAAYGPIRDEVQRRYGVSTARSVLLAATDTMWRPFVTTFSRLARESQVFVAATTDVADVQETSDPELMHLFADPAHPERTTVFAPVDGNAYNQTVLFGPDGRIVGRTHKVNLVSLEQEFDLAPGSLDDVKVFDLPVGKLGVAISLDAFTASYVSRIDQLGAQIVVQNDANDGEWCGPGGQGDWQPREWMGSIFGALGSSYPNLRYDVCPMMTGNLYDIPFDGQTTITVKDPSSGPPPMSFVGVDDAPYPGRFLALGAWVIDDPGKTNPSLTLDQRRALLSQKSVDLTPGGADADGYLQTLVWADVDLE